MLSARFLRRKTLVSILPACSLSAALVAAAGQADAVRVPDLNWTSYGRTHDEQLRAARADQPP
jgi:hypothetical protein